MCGNAWFRMGCCWCLSGFLPLLALPPSAAADIAPSSAALLNSTATTDGSAGDLAPAVVSDGQGHWVAVWHSPFNLGGTTGTDNDLLVSRSEDHGTTWTQVQALNSTATSDPGRSDTYPSLCTGANGTWLAVWSSQNDFSGTTGTDDDILFARSTDNGATWTDAALLNATGTGDGTSSDTRAQAATDGQGNWVVVWQSNYGLNGAGTDADILVSYSSDDAATWSDPALLNDWATSDASSNDIAPQLATDGKGNWGCVWYSTFNLGGTAGTDQDIIISRSSDNGATWTAGALVNDFGNAETRTDADPDIAVDVRGHWVVVWDSYYNLGGAIGLDSDILCAASSDYGVSWSAAAVLNSTAGSDGARDDFFPCVSYDGAGNWVTAWFSKYEFEGSGTDDDIMAAHSTDYGASWGSVELLNTTAKTDSTSPDQLVSLAADGQGNWVSIWESYYNLGGSGNDSDIFFTRFSLPLLDVVPPTADAVTAAELGPTNASSMAFTIEFSEAVSGFDAESDLTFSHEGTAHSSVAITQDNPTSFTVDINGITGDGTFSLAVNTASNVRDLADNILESSVTSAVVIIDNTPPLLTLLGQAEVSTEAGAAYIDAGVSAADNVDGDLTALVVTENPVSTSVLDSYTVRYNVSDTAGNAAVEQTRLVHVVDTTPPAMSLLGEGELTVEAGSSYTDAGATAQDSFDGDLTAFIVTSNTVNTAVLGEYSVTYNVSDTSGNAAAQLARLVQVVDTTPPVITLLGDSPVTVEAGSSYTDAGATASDSFEGDLTSEIIAQSSVNTSALGTYEVTYDVSDASGNTAAQVTRVVQVVDTTPPAISLLGDSPVSVEAGSSYTDAGATASDSFEGDLTSEIMVQNSVNTAALGTYEVTYDVSDASGNTAAQVTRVVQVVDTTPPVITLLGDSPVSVEAGSSYTDAGATALDSFDGDLTSGIAVAGEVNAEVPGTYAITYDVTDASGNAAVQVVRTVLVVDTAAPNAPVVSGPASPVAETMPQWTWSSGGGGGNGLFRWRLNGGEWSAEALATAYGPAAPLADGTHTLEVQERDEAGNWSAAGAFAVTISSSGPGSTIYIDFAYSGTEAGTESQPFRSLAAGLDAVTAGGTLHLAAGESSETPVIAKSVTLRTDSGPVRIGVAGAKSGMLPDGAATFKAPPAASTEEALAAQLLLGFSTADLNGDGRLAAEEVDAALRSDSDAAAGLRARARQSNDGLTREELRRLSAPQAWGCIPAALDPQHWPQIIADFFLLALVAAALRLWRTPGARD